MRLYVKFFFSSEGASPLDVIQRAKEAGLGPEIGDFDASIHFANPERYSEIVLGLNAALKGTGTKYTLTTKDH